MRAQVTCGLLILLLAELLSRCHCSTNLTNWIVVGCKGHQDCPSDMECERNKCICEPDKIYDQIKLVCATEVGHYCRNTTECVSNAVCDQKQRLCVCHGPIFSKAENGKCLKNYGMSCQNQSDCNPNKHLTCRLNKCDCVNSMEQGYSVSQGEKGCLALPGEKCDLNGYYTSPMKLECGFHSTCSKRDSVEDDFHGICKCDPGYTRVGKNQPDCMPSFGSPCKSTDPCASGLHLECDETENPGVCKCEFNARVVEIVNDVHEIKCALLEGVPCIKGESICTQNAECKNNGSVSICECNFGYFRTPAGQCKRDYLRPCNEEGDNCNEFIGLKCISDKCRCERGQVFDGNLRKCVIPVGQTCDPGNSNLGCPNHAFCDPEKRVCTCQKPMMPRLQKYSDGFCYLGFGAPCKVGDGNFNSSCVGGNYMICGSQNVCQCNNGSIFEKKSSYCFLPVGAKCSEARGDVCVSRATCQEKDGVGICDCGNGYIPGIKDGKCGLGHGKHCIPTEDECSQEIFLSCVEMNQNGEYICGCSKKDGLIYDEATKSCRSLNGFICDNENGPFCSENSECVKNLGIGQNSHVCKCTHNFIASNLTNHRCVSENEFSSSQTHNSSSSIGNRIFDFRNGGRWTGLIVVVSYGSFVY